VSDTYGPGDEDAREGQTNGGHEQPQPPQGGQPPARGEHPQQPPGEQPPAGDGLDPQVGGLLSYLIFMWIGGLAMYLTQRHPEVRFHAAQSILTSIAIFAIYVGLAILSAIVTIGVGALQAVFTLLFTLLWLASLALWILLCVKGYQLEHFKLPVVGDMAEGWAAR
jgi:uncharacterized membrane protein